MSVRTTKDPLVLSTRNDAEVLADLLLIAQTQLVRDADQLSQCGAINGARVCLALASRAHDMRIKLTTEQENTK